MMPKQDAVEELRDEAVLYVRVSSKRQSEEGHGLDGQEHRGREYCSYKDYTVAEVFSDAGISGGVTDRPGIKGMLRYLKKRRKTLPPKVRLICVIDEVSRLARDIRGHLDLKDAIYDAGAVLESPGMEFGTDSNSILFEQTQAIFAEHHRRRNAEQVYNRMRARVLSGYYCFSPVYGFDYIDADGGGRVLAPKEPEASVVRETLEGFACGRFRSPTEVARFLNNFPSVPKNIHGEVRLQRAIDMLKNPLYAGYITIKKWDVYLQPGKHTPIIDFAIWQKVQRRLEAPKSGAVRKDNSKDFVMRGFVSCPSCDRAMTAGWSKSGTGKKYPYYICQTRKCDRRGKSVNRNKMEGEFEALLQTLKPAPQIFAALRAIFADHWDTQKQRSQEIIQQAHVELETIRAQTSKLINRIVDTDDKRIITAYEDQIRVLDQRKTMLNETMAGRGGSTESFEKLYRTACAFLSNPKPLWDTGRYELRRLVLRLILPNPIQYCKNDGYRTSGIAEPLRLLQAFSTQGCGMVEPDGIEPTTSTMPL